MSLVSCDICGSVLNPKYLGQHKTKVHSVQMIQQNTHICYFCQKNNKSIKDYIFHLQNEHNQSEILIKNETFASQAGKFFVD